MAATPGGLTATIRRKLQDGKTPDEVVQELVAGGLGKASAERFVDRALAEDASAAPLPPAPALPNHAADAPADGLDQFIQTKTAETEAENARTGTRQLWVACALMCAGIAITGFSYVMADPGERYTVMWGPVAFGFFLWGRSVLQGFANARTFAWVSAAASIALPAVLTVVTLGVVAAIGAEPIDDNTQAELVRIRETKSTPGNRNAAIEQSYKDEFAARRASLDVDGLLARWDAASEEDEPDEIRLKCDFAMQMSTYTGEHRQWLAQELTARIHTATNDQVKICNAATALQLDWETGAGIYQLWQNGDNPRLKSAATRAMARSAR